MDDAHVIDLDSDSEYTRTPCYDCDFCDEFFYSRADLRKHLQHHNCDDINCSSCHTTGRIIENPDDNACFYKSNIAASGLVHEKRIPHSIILNGQGCRNQSSTVSSEDDIEIQSKENPSTEAPSKERTFPLFRHIFFCTECNSRFRRKGNLLRHENFRVCVSAWGTQKSYAQHFFYCSICSSKFKKKSNLIRHENSHILKFTTRHLFFCTECNKAFTKRSSLIRHERSYLAKKSFACPDCNVKFSSNFNLKRHKYLHLKKKHFKCSKCKKKFAHVYYLNVHVSSHNNDKKFKCGICDNEYKTKCGLNRHCLKKHPSN